jgi:AcrR family transcriptional regulator
LETEDVNTRVRLLEAAQKLARRRGISAVTMAGVGKEAGVTRQTVYLYFGSPSTLLSEMMLRRFQTHPLSQRARELSLQPASVATFEEFVTVALRFVDDVGVVAFAEWAQAARDKAMLKAIQERCDASAAMTARIMSGLKSQGLLRAGWKPEEAAEWVNHQLFPTSYFGLAVVRRWPLERIIERTLDMLRRDVLDLGGAEKRSSLRNRTSA